MGRSRKGKTGEGGGVEGNVVLERKGGRMGRGGGGWQGGGERKAGEGVFREIHSNHLKPVRPRPGGGNRKKKKEKKKKKKKKKKEKKKKKKKKITCRGAKNVVAPPRLPGPM